MVISHLKIHFVDDRKKRDLIHRGVEPCSSRLDRQTARIVRAEGKVRVARLPQPKEVNIGSLDPADILKIRQLILVEPKVAVQLHLALDLLHHLRCEEHILVAAFERPGRLVVTELVINPLSHRELISIRLQQTVHDSFHNVSPPTLRRKTRDSQRLRGLPPVVFTMETLTKQLSESPYHTYYTIILRRLQRFRRKNSPATRPESP